MRRLILHLFLLILWSIPTLAAVTPKLSSPIYLATVLVNKPDLQTMVELCDYYGLTPAPEEDGYTVYTTPDGSTIRFKMVDESSSNKTDMRSASSARYRSSALPIVEVFSKESKKKISTILQEAGFNKTPNGYESSSRFVPNRTRVTFSNRKVTFKKVN